MTLDRLTCPLCNKANSCAIDAPAGCWCMTANIPEELLKQIPKELKNTACVCQHCVTAFNNSKQCQ